MFLIALLAKFGLFVFLTWTTPRTWVPGELVTASMMNTHVRDNLNGLKTLHFVNQTFRGLHVRTHPDSDAAAAKVWATWDQIVMDDGYHYDVPTAPLVADITASGAAGLDTGAEGANTWYEIYAIGKSSTLALADVKILLHKAKIYSANQQQATQDQSRQIRSGATTNIKIGQGFKTSITGLIEFIDIQLNRNASPTGNLWLTIETDSAGKPSGSVLATSDKIDVSKISASLQTVRFPFRAPVSVTATTQYHYVIQADYTVSGTNNIAVYSKGTASSYADGAENLYDGTTYTTNANVDNWFKIYVTITAAVTMPSGYDQQCKLGFAFNDGWSNFIRFIAKDRLVTLLSQLSAGAIVATIPTLTNMSTLIPPGTAEIWFAPSLNTSTMTVQFAGVPDGLGLAASNRTTPTGLTSIYAPAVSEFFGAWVHTEYQGLYVQVSAGTATMYVAGWRW
jgi:hypothetical protein